MNSNKTETIFRQIQLNLNFMKVKSIFPKWMISEIMINSELCIIIQMRPNLGRQIMVETGIIIHRWKVMVKR